LRPRRRSNRLGLSGGPNKSIHSPSSYLLLPRTTENDLGPACNTTASEAKSPVFTTRAESNRVRKWLSRRRGTPSSADRVEGSSTLNRHGVYCCSSKSTVNRVARKWDQKNKQRRPGSRRRRGRHLLVLIWNRNSDWIQLWIRTWVRTGVLSNRSRSRRKANN
jgi:hypothetical protein